MEKPLTSVRRESMDLTGAKRRTRCRTPSFVR